MRLCFRVGQPCDAIQGVVGSLVAQVRHVEQEISSLNEEPVPTHTLALHLYEEAVTGDSELMIRQKAYLWVLNQPFVYRTDFACLWVSCKAVPIVKDPCTSKRLWLILQPLLLGGLQLPKVGIIPTLLQQIMMIACFN